jgi:hypothetical protein
MVDILVSPEERVHGVLEELVLAIVFGIKEGVEAHTHSPVESQPGKRVSIESGPHLEPVEMDGHGDPLCAAAVGLAVRGDTFAIDVDESVVGGVRISTGFKTLNLLAYSAKGISCGVVVERGIVAATLNIRIRESVVIRVL